jgi:hypothetical protein
VVGRKWVIEKKKLLTYIIGEIQYLVRVDDRFFLKLIFLIIIAHIY